MGLLHSLEMVGKDVRSLFDSISYEAVPVTG